MEELFCPKNAGKFRLFSSTNVYIQVIARNMGKRLFYRPKIPQARTFCSRKEGKEILDAATSIQTTVWLLGV
jgi:hypothetical protein